MISAITGAVAAVGGLLAAAAAFRSAGNARAAAARSEKVEIRELANKLIVLAHSIVTESERVDDLAAKLKRGYDDLFRFAGDAKRAKPHIAEVEDSRKSIADFRTEAAKIPEHRMDLQKKSEQELSEKLIMYDGYLQKIKAVKEKCALELASVEREVREVERRRQPSANAR
jgi:hypothetical protein